MIKYTQVLVIVITLTIAPAISEAKQEHVIRGRTMGTTYSVKVVTGNIEGISGVKEKIDESGWRKSTGACPPIKGIARSADLTALKKSGKDSKFPMIFFR
jgi:hypothetical protein